MGRFRYRLLGFALIATVLLPSVAGCGAIDQTIQRVAPTNRGVLRLAGRPPVTLDPAISQDVTSWGYLVEIYSGLVRLDNNLQVVPDIARSWTVSADGRTYTFLLRGDVHFDDGRLVTAQDFKYSLERALDPATRSPVAPVYLGDIVGAKERLAGQAASVSGVVVVNAQVLQITIDAPKSYFLAKLTYPTAFVVDSKNVQNGTTWSTHPNGTGPFELKSLDSQKELVLVRMARYYGPSPTLAEVDFVFGPESPMGLYEKGQLDVVSLGQGDIPRTTDPQGPLHDQLRVTPLLSLWYLGMNVHQKPFDDPKVRLAFAYATDKRAIVSGRFQGTKKAANGMLPPGLPGYDASDPGIPFDPQKAKDELAASTYRSAANLPKIVLSVPDGSGDFAEGLAQMYRVNLGVDVSVEVIQDSFFSDLEQHDAQMYDVGWVADYPDSQDFLGVLFAGGGQSDYSDYDNPKVDQVLASAQAATDAQQRANLYRQADQLIVQDAPAIPLFYDMEYDLVRPTVKGLTITPIGIHSFAGVTVQG